jgi:hypothetical protein
MLYNKTSARLVYGTCVENIQSILTRYEYKISEFDYLNNLNQGLVVKSEIIKLKTKFQFFFANYLITNREVLNKEPGVLYLEKFTIAIGKSKNLAKLLIDELGQVPSILEKLGQINRQPE